MTEECISDWGLPKGNEAAQPGTRNSAHPRRGRRQAYSEEMIIMAGSNMAAIVIPIVVMFSLAAWIAMV